MKLLLPLSAPVPLTRTATTTANLLALHPSLAASSIRPQLLQRCYASSSSSYQAPPGSKRRAVTPFNDDGHVPWTELSAGEKTARAAQQTFNFGMVVVGLVLTGGVGYFLYTEVFSPSGKVAYFNRAVDRIKKDPRCLELLGDAKKITAHGEETSNKWRRARPIASTTTKDAQGAEHMRMHFHVEGPRNRGLVSVYLVRRPGQPDYEYRHLFVDVRGHPRIYLENAEAARASGGGAGGGGGGGADKPKTTLFGIKWT